MEEKWKGVSEMEGCAHRQTTKVKETMTPPEDLKQPVE